MKMLVILLLIAGSVGGYLYYENHQSHEANIEATAAGVVNQLLEDSLLSVYHEGATCERVVIMEKTGRRSYKGRAILDTGKVINVVIEDLDDFVSVAVDTE